MCDKIDNNNPSAFNIPSKPYIITKKNAKAFKRKARKSEKAVREWDLDKLEFEKYMIEKE